MLSFPYYDNCLSSGVCVLYLPVTIYFNKLKWS